MRGRYALFLHDATRHERNISSTCVIGITTIVLIRPFILYDKTIFHKITGFVIRGICRLPVSQRELRRPQQ